jgi:serine protease Do
MKQGTNRINIYVLFLGIGVIAGAIIGGEIIRRIMSRSTGSPLITQVVAPSVDQKEIAPKAPTIESVRNTAIVTATKTISPTVVGIVVTQLQQVNTPANTGDFFDLFFAPEMVPRYKEIENMGSGTVLDSMGLIVTNYHVIEGAQKLFVNFPDGHELEGKIFAADPQSDVALIKVQAKGLRFAPMGNSDSLLTGEWAIAFGNPFGYFINDAHPTVTVGVISALNRNFSATEGALYRGMIQTDAAINPGNSGGPLVNALGEVVGINTFIYTGSKTNKGSIGIGFAVPINRVRRVVEELKTYHNRRPVWTGIAVQDITRELALALGLKRVAGVIVTNIIPKSPGDKCGLKPGDVITSLGIHRIASSSDIEGFFLDYFVGDQIRIRYLRNAKEFSTTVTLETPKETIQ